MMMMITIQIKNIWKLKKVIVIIIKFKRYVKMYVQKMQSERQTV